MGKKLITLGLAYFAAFLFFMLINPHKLPFALILLPFIILFLLIYMSVQVVLSVFFIINSRQKRVISLVLATMPVLMLIIQTVTQLTVRDVILSVSITIVLIWYSVRSGLGSNKS